MSPARNVPVVRTTAPASNIDVRWRHSGNGGGVGGGGDRSNVNRLSRGVVGANTTAMAQCQPQTPSFNTVIRRMENDVDSTGVHHTILRFCADVLGSLRREEFRNLRRQMQ